MKKISKKYRGIYECRHELDGKVVSTDWVEIKVYHNIEMGENLDNKRSFVGTAGQTFSFPCTAQFDSESCTTTDSHHINWFHNGQRIAESKLMLFYRKVPI